MIPSDIPISGRMKQLRDENFTADHAASVSKLGNASPDQEPSPVFSKAFYEADDIIPEIDALERKIKEATFKSQRALLNKKLGRLNEHFARLTTRNYNFNGLVMKYIEAHGGKIENIADLIRWLRHHGELRSIQDHAARVRLRKTFDITG